MRKIYFAAILGLVLMFLPRAYCATGTCVSGNCENGTGKFVYADGGWYEGEYKNGESNGTGTVHNIDGYEYHGSFKDGHRNGQGTERWQDGNYFKGNFENSLREGFGSLYHKDGAVVEQGKYSKGKLVEPGPPPVSASAAKTATAAKTPCHECDLVLFSYIGKNAAAAVKDALDSGASANAELQDEEGKKDTGTPAIVVAAGSNDTPEISELLLENGADVNARDFEGNTALMIAAIKRKTAIVRFLLSKGADVSLKNNKGIMAVDCAVGGKRPVDQEIVTMLQAAAKTSAPKKTAASAEDIEKMGRYLLEGVLTKDVKEVKDALIARASADTRMSDDHNEGLGATALMLAADTHSNPEIAGMLLDNGADINARDRDGNTPLMHAVLTQNDPMVKFLLSKGAAVNLTNKMGYSELSLVLTRPVNDKRAVSKITDMLNAAGGKRSANEIRDSSETEKQWDALLLGAVHDENILVLDSALSLGASANARLPDATNDGPRLTALMDAARRNKDTEIARSLLNKGADINARDRDGKTALMYAVESFNEPLIKFLLKKGADVNLKDKDGNTVVHRYLAAGGSADPDVSDILKMLKKAGGKE